MVKVVVVCSDCRGVQFLQDPNQKSSDGGYSLLGTYCTPW